jgi:chromosome segregation protein
MYLSKLEIFGFKSFAQKVTLVFDSGISAIVGPNGCGKTNIVDAIRWVLGEQRYSALRSEKMEDVIFNGTKTRKPLGLAEASLVIENTKGILPSEYTQVTIGRRVYRSGESEYFLNRVPCRLKDILDLFMDTGMGADAYSVIELKMIETILSDRTDERRRLFEEAAGVTKYKHRRKAAYRKLESVQADLVRVNDIVAEVQKAVNSLERQARRAEQHNELRLRLRELETDLMEREFAQLSERLTPLKERRAKLQDAKILGDTDLAKEEARLENLRSGMLELEKRLAEAQRDASIQREKMHRTEELRLIGTEQIKGLRTHIGRLETEHQELEENRQRQLLLQEDLQSQRVKFQEEEALKAAELEQRQAELREMETRLEATKADVKAFNDRTIALVHQIADRQSEYERKQDRFEALTGSKTDAEQEIESYRAESASLDGRINAMSEEDRLLRRTFAEAEMRLADAETRKNALRDQAETVRQRQGELRAENERTLARIDFLKGLIERQEGLSEGVRFLTTHEHWTPQRRVTVADALHAESRYLTALEAALGEAAGLMIVDTASDAESGVILLNDHQRGKATFVCLDRLPRITRRVALPHIEGVHGWAIELAQFDQEYAPLFSLLLDRVVVVEDRDTARQVAAVTTGLRCVTLDGEIATSVGIVRGGSRRQDEGGTIGKQQQIEELQRTADLQVTRLRALGDEHAGILRDHDAIDLRAFTDAVKSVEKEMTAVEVRIAQLAFEKKRAEDMIAGNTEAIGRINTECEGLRQEIETMLPAIEAVKHEKEEVELRTTETGEDLRGREQAWDDRQRLVQKLGIALATIRGELQNTLNGLERTAETIRRMTEGQEKDQNDIHASLETIAGTEIQLEEHGTILNAMQLDLAQLDERRVSVEEEASCRREETHQLELTIRDQRRLHDDALKTIHDVDLKVADLTAKMDHLVARAREEFEITIELKTYAEDEFVDFAALRDEIQGFKDRLKNLGNINFAAFEEYTTEKQRAEFMTTQRQDLLEAEKTLLATIEEINATAQKKFLDTFALIRSNFIETFKSLFDPGDECDLRLEENVDPLEARIEIVAKPRGKRPTSIDLLSGGEKTLTATALLFAIYLVKPSPFCILDEVDAPLDDANVDRFTRILRKFSNNTQFIVVTHNKRTMEAANAMYGVTMEEEGISKIVTVRFNEGTQVTEASLATA